MADKLTGKSAVVTGGGMGNGRAFALGLANEGADVAIFDMNREAAENTAAEIKKLGPKALALQGDVSKPADIEKAVAEASRQFGKIDILVNNAGIYPSAPFLEKKEDEVDKVWAINLKGPFFFTQAVAKDMVNKGVKGSVINISSSHALLGMAIGMVDYSASKGGVNAMTRAAAAELSRYGIRVNAICLGLTRTPGTQALPGGLEPMEKLFTSILAIPRLAVPEDYVGLLVWLASDESGYCTGSHFVVDGGQVSCFIPPGSR
jgi:NAD(P)-dependent dehydrogenase (short-subunit alcohol dehydrogenase family)